MPIHNFNTLQGKQNAFASVQRIENEQDLHQIVDQLNASPNFLFRGVCEAKFRMYSSSQRKWAWYDPIRYKIGRTDYHHFIRGLIDTVRRDSDIMGYFNQYQIPVNDMLILAILQHYAVVSPLLDLTSDVYSALFFAVDGYGAASNDGSLDDYVSLYYIDRSVDWMQATIQKIHLHGAINADSMLASHNGLVDTAQFRNNLENLTYESVKDLPFIAVDGPGVGITEVNMPHLGFSCSYHIANPRLCSQSGLFILNNSEDKPLEEVMNNTTKRPLFHCLDINKALIPYIRDTILTPRNINKDTLYCTDSESVRLENAITKLFHVDCLCFICNFASKYREPIYQKLDAQYPIDWYCGKYDTDIAELDYSKLKRVTLIENKRFIKDPLYFQQGVLALLRRKEYSVYLMTGELWCVSTWLFAALKKIVAPRKKVYFWTHGWYGKESRMRAMLKRMYFRLADGIFLYGDYARRLMIEQGFNPDKLWVIHNSLDYEYHQQLLAKINETDVYRLHFGNDYPNLLFIGRLTTVKRIDQLIEAMKLLDTKGVRCNLTLVGDGVEKTALQDLVKKYHLVKRVWFYGACYDDLRNSELIYNADLCVAPGNVGLTAMHCMTFGTPVISHDSFPYQMPEFEAIIPQQTGDFFRYGDVQSLVETIEGWLQNNSADRQRVREACFAEIKKHWNPTAQMEVFNKYLNI